MATDGFFGKPSDWILLAIMFWAYALATRSTTTNSTPKMTRMTSSTIQPRPRRRRRRGAGRCHAGSCQGPAPLGESCQDPPPLGEYSGGCSGHPFRGCDWSGYTLTSLHSGVRAVHHRLYPYSPTTWPVTGNVHTGKCLIRPRGKAGRGPKEGGARPSPGYSLSVVCCAAAETCSPCDVTATLFTCRPAGSLGMGNEKLPNELSTELSGLPLLTT